MPRLAAGDGRASAGGHAEIGTGRVVARKNTCDADGAGDIAVGGDVHRPAAAVTAKVPKSSLPVTVVPVPVVMLRSVPQRRFLFSA